MAGIKSAGCCRLDDFAMASLLESQNQNRHPRRKIGGDRASARHFVINKSAYNWLYRDPVIRMSLRAFATTDVRYCRRPLCSNVSIDTDRQVHSSPLFVCSGTQCRVSQRNRTREPAVARKGRRRSARRPFLLVCFGGCASLTHPACANSTSGENAHLKSVPACQAAA
jgi:hypothetical protein